MTDREKAIRKRLRDDFPHYAEKCLKIYNKAGKLEPFLLNEAQQYIHAQLEAQKARTGRVRALILKGRQQGASTYISGRFYHRATHRPGTQVYILTHEQTATDTLFSKVDCYHKHNNPLVTPATGASNAKELSFSRLGSAYAVGTAGSKAVGRSKTIQLFHGSEVAFWPNAAAHFSGVVQAVPDLPETEVVLESTANGVGGEYHERWQQAEAGIGDYIAVFVPWFWSAEYARPVPEGFTLDDSEAEYMQTYGLSLEQMVWRRAKIAELKDPSLFMQEYPATAAEAFQMSGHDSFIKPADVLAARKATLDGIGPLIIGADPARYGDDRFSLAWRKGRKVLKTESKAKLSVVDGANWIKDVIDEDNPARVFIDVGGLGAGVYDILKSWGGSYEKACVPVNFGSAPQSDVVMLPDGTKKPGPKNRRSEMWMRSRDWLQELGGADIPDVDGLQADACGPSFSYDANQRILLESKEAMRARGLRSPDDWDAIALTFAEPVKDKPAATTQNLTNWGSESWMGA